MNIEPDIRNGARAVIRRAGAVLLLLKESPAYGRRYVLPGGSQDPGETLTEALIRECVEEIGVAVTDPKLIHVADFYKLRNAEPESYRHVVEFLFSCRVHDDYVPENGLRPDRHQKAVEWVPMSELNRIPLYPVQFSSVFRDDGEMPIYLGRIE